MTKSNRELRDAAKRIDTPEKLRKIIADCGFTVNDDELERSFKTLQSIKLKDDDLDTVSGGSAIDEETLLKDYPDGENRIIKKLLDELRVIKESIQ
jgi:hypothetical protein